MQFPVKLQRPLIPVRAVSVNAMFGKTTAPSAKGNETAIAAKAEVSLCFALPEEKSDYRVSICSA